MHDLIATPFQTDHLVLRTGSPKAIKVPSAKFAELRSAVSDDAAVPRWLADTASRAWGIDLADRSTAETVLMRAPGPYGFSRATWEINLGCDFDCEHCYLGEKRFEGPDRAGKEQLLLVVRDAGVI
ncbi:hypothetical protein [Streptomyces sp. NPDC101150]|uniref:hypothetical protein n=1 Tax=Streptomyces sp. NPDC101150 TaxID=3366114 RepID=UPI003816CC8D